MNFAVYLRLIVLTAGTLLPFFWIVVILGHRRQRNFERILFFLCLSMVCFFGASLLALNAQLYYSTIPPGLATFSWTVLCLGLWFLPALLLHLHVEYAQIRELLRPGSEKRLWLVAAYAPAVLLAQRLFGAFRLREGFSFLLPSNALGTSFQIWLVCALSLSAWWQWRFRRTAPDAEQKSFHRSLRTNLALIAVWMAVLHFVFPRMGKATEQNAEVYITIVGLFALAPLVALIRNVQRFNFLQIGRQRNLIFAVFAAFVALLYFSLIRRVSLWLEPYLPPEATAAILLFLPVVLFEPLQRLVGRVLRRTAHAELDRAQRMMGPIQEVARLGDLERLADFTERWVSEQLQVAKVKLLLGASADAVAGRAEPEELFAIRQAGNAIGFLRVRAHGAMLSGETAAALEFLCEQLPGALDLCRLIEEKLQLERELAERERLALVGQMAASISHNLKNPLGSMKTILQLQLENPGLPASLRRDCELVISEIDRLGAKLGQLLRFSKPALRGGASGQHMDARAVAQQVAGLLRHDAERRGVKLAFEAVGCEFEVRGSEEALSDVLSNLLVNAIEALGHGGRVGVSAASQDGFCTLAVEDDGPGIPAALREKILQPFFTTKSQGTGLGLAIVARRVAEFGGKVEWESPVRDGSGTRFRVTLPMEEAKK